jgi:Fur family zinc uptake transcriptional regulator
MRSVPQSASLSAPAAGLKGKALKVALTMAERRCAAKQEELKAPSRRVLEKLLSAGAPQKAYQMMSHFTPDGRPTSPTVVYRALNFLLRMGLIHRLETLNAYVVCRLGAGPHRPGFLVCDACGAAEEHELDRLPPFIAAHAKSLTQVVVEAHWRCAACTPAGSVPR